MSGGLRGWLRDERAKRGNSRSHEPSVGEVNGTESGEEEERRMEIRGM